MHINVKNNNFTNIMNHQNRNNMLENKVVLRIAAALIMNLDHNKFTNCSYDYDNGIIGYSG